MALSEDPALASSDPRGMNYIINLILLLLTVIHRLIPYTFERYFDTSIRALVYIDSLRYATCHSSPLPIDLPLLVIPLLASSASDSARPRRDFSTWHNSSQVPRMGGRLSMPRGPDGMNEISKPTSFSRNRGIINGRVRAAYPRSSPQLKY